MKISSIDTVANGEASISSHKDEPEPLPERSEAHSWTEKAFANFLKEYRNRVRVKSATDQPSVSNGQETLEAPREPTEYAVDSTHANDRCPHNQLNGIALPSQLAQHIQPGSIA